jgi:hypothetical protein
VAIPGIELAFLRARSRIKKGATATTRGRKGDMSQRSWGRVVGCMWLLTVAACGQELVLPTPRSDRESAGAPDEGVTGPTIDAGGAAARGRLPIADLPSFSSFSGEGGALTTDVGGDAVDGEGGAIDSEPGGGSESGGTQANGGAGSGPSTVSGAAGGAAGANNEGGGAGGTITEPPRLWFSEYVEGSGSYKALEIYAANAASLEGCDLETYFNGKTEPARLALHGVLDSGTVQVLCSTTLAAQAPAQCSRSTSLTFNGDDALALRCSGMLLDVIGEIGVDPGTAWANGATADHTLRRRCSVKAGNPAPAPGFEPDAEWQTFGVDTFTDLGRYDCSP